MPDATEWSLYCKNFARLYNTTQEKIFAPRHAHRRQAAQHDIVRLYFIEICNVSILKWWELLIVIGAFVDLCG